MWSFFNTRWLIKYLAINLLIGVCGLGAMYVVLQTPTWWNQQVKIAADARLKYKCIDHGLTNAFDIDECVQLQKAISAARYEWYLKTGRY